MTEFQQSIYIQAPVAVVEQTIIDPMLMHRWLNPLLRCQPVGEWCTALGGQFRFSLRIPILEPTLQATVIERQPGLIVWRFEGFFSGCDRWQCHPEGEGTRLLNCFEFSIPNPLVAFGFHTFAAGLTQQDMQRQLRRLKAVAETQSLEQMQQP